MADDNTEEQQPQEERAVQRGGAVAAGAGSYGVVVVEQPEKGGALAIPRMSRRKVVITSFWAGMGLALLGIGATIINTLYPRGVNGFGGPVFVGTVDDFPPGSKIRNVTAKAWIVRLNAEQAARNGAEEGALLALYQKCPHLGCTVPWEPAHTREDPRSRQRYAGWFLCPCHGSTYSDAGVRVFGPAPRSMDTMSISIEDGNITLNTGDITEGGEDNGARGVLPG